MKVAIVAHAKTSLTEHQIQILKNCDLIIAADGGADHLLTSQLKPDLIIGDLDGISKNALNAFRNSVEIQSFPKDKDHTDLELAVHEGVKRGATELHIFCWADERIDYSYGTLLAVAESRIAVTLYIIEGEVIILNAARPEIKIPHPCKLSVYPLNLDCSLTSRGLKWELNWTSSNPRPRLSQSNETLRESSLALSSGTAFCFISNSSL